MFHVSIHLLRATGYGNGLFNCFKPPFGKGATIQKGTGVTGAITNDYSTNASEVANQLGISASQIMVKRGFGFTKYELI